MLLARNRVRSASFNNRSRKLPSGSGVNLLNSGRINTGASTAITSWNPSKAPHAHNHHHRPVHSTSFSTSTSNGYPSTTPSNNPFNRSIHQSFCVVVLKPNLSSNRNCAYQSNGNPGSASATIVPKRNAAPAQAQLSSQCVNQWHPHGSTPLNRATNKTAAS